MGTLRIQHPLRDRSGLTLTRFPVGLSPMSGNVIASKQDSVPCPHARNLVCDKTRVHCRVRRLVVVGSLYFKLKGIKNPDQCELDSVNGKLHLACHSTSLLFPAAISAWMWKRIDPAQLVERLQRGEIDLTQLSRELVAKMPRWFRYGDGSAFTMDVRAVLDCLRTA